ncbi:hypothetical protein dsx2_0747 [Desulfovibrio sp. X2]|uniref:esterase/lipase family protein n=1 Tax=Desulfovibrio sp. X2 TaxID=941449 RepID=UPI0003587FD2|nr:alpha/beta fold hydrolase [Desulfovibrio sp. X2]EPR37401.1 hypothetical protein dsx2_0747 [Desulfovibrio sp. X2]
MTELLTLLALLAALAVVMALFTAGVSHAMLWYECRGTPHEKRLRDLAKGGVRVWLLGRIVVSAACQLFLYATYPLGWLGRHAPPAFGKEPEAGPDEPCMLLVHGLYHNAAAWLRFAPRLRRAGYKDLRAVCYGSFARGFDEVADDVAGRIREIVRENGERPLLLIGHSLGGLFVRRALADPGIAAACRAAVTLGSPHQGSRLSAFGIGRLVRDLHPSSAAIRAMRELPGARGVPCLALRSPADGMVVPPEGLEPPEGAGFETITTPPCDHIQMLYHQGVAALVADFLRRAAPAPRS